jgi:hypothetical protein
MTLTPARKLIAAVAVFGFGMLAGAGIAAWLAAFVNFDGGW